MTKTARFFLVLAVLTALIVAPAFAKGAKELAPEEPEPLVSEEKARPVYSIVNKDDLFSRFSYAYGYALTDDLLSQGVSLNGAYWLRGLADVFGYAESPLIEPESMDGIVNQYVAQFYQVGLTEDPGDMPEFINIYTMGAPETLVEQFSYSYGFVYALQIYIYNALDIYSTDFMEGAAAALWPTETQLTDEEMNQALNDYADYLDAEFEAYSEELKKQNLEIAEAFLEANKENEGVIVLPSGDQMVIISEAEELGATPSATDSIVCDYNLFLLDGTEIDSGENVTFSLTSLITGFTEACTNMKVGQEVFVYIHPQYGYGENGAGTIEPNALLCFRIVLKGIVSAD